MSIIERNKDEIINTMPLEAAQKIIDSLEVNYYENVNSLSDRPDLEKDILANLMRRQAAFEEFLVPWVNLRRNLAGATVVDIGCGTGSSTAAFARVAKSVRGYEIESGPTRVASDRLKALNLGNASVCRIEPAETIDIIRREHPGGVDVIALIAVLEHMTVEERLTFLPEIWDFMRPGSILVVAELPNRLTYFDDHTFQMPFIHLLPWQLKKRYVHHSPRGGFPSILQGMPDADRSKIELYLARWGLGLSFHDFEIGFGVDDLHTIMLADGYEHETIMWWPPQTEERILMKYFVEKPIRKPLGFSRNVLNFIFMKPKESSTLPLLKHSGAHLESIWKKFDLPNDGLSRFSGMCV